MIYFEGLYCPDMNVARVKNTYINTNICKVTSEMGKAENCWVLCISTREIDQSIVDYIFNVGITLFVRPYVRLFLHY